MSDITPSSLTNLAPAFRTVETLIAVPSGTATQLVKQDPTRVALIFACPTANTMSVSTRRNDRDLFQTGRYN
jgi:hypothetical protein